ncbi:MAG TPA: MFS transporter [Acidiferrobacteraceae bacterium]|nr:MFS transporter [Acidiferrobacteraceae bacterium]HEX19249.1 MFS transporter [Acidiferrobacteraceae bacterium]
MPYWRLSGFYFFYFSALGVLVSWLGLYFKQIGFDAAQIGYITAIMYLSRIVAPNIWAWAADYSGQRLWIVKLASLLALISFTAAFFTTDFWWLALVFLLFSFFWNAALPQVEAATMQHSLGETSVYSRVRLWGSVGFIVVAIGLGPILDVTSYWWVLPSLFVCLLGIFIFSLMIPESQVEVSNEVAEPLLRLMMRPRVAAFLLVCLLMQASHGPYYTFYSIYLNESGYSGTAIGLLWGFGVVCEIAVFLWLHHVKRHIGLRHILLISFSLAALRWLLIGFFPQQVWILIFAQVLHAVTFGVYHATAIEMVHKFFTGRHHCRGQAIYGSISFGIGGALGSFYSGLLWKQAGATMTFAVAAGLAFFAFIIVAVFIRPGNSGDVVASGPGQ